MSRKKAKQSNTRIGIFTGKSALHNLGILKTLYKLKAATAWQIAKNLSNTPEMSKEALDYRARHLYSIIQRKEGRLADLENKGYIKQQEGLWEPTLKGSIALGIKNPEILERELQTETKSYVFNQYKESFNTIPDKQIKKPFGISINLSETRRDLNKLMDQISNNPAVFKITLNETEAMLRDGIDLDQIKEGTLVTLLLNSSDFKKALKDLTKNL